MDKSQRSFLKHLSQAPASQVVPTLRAARRKDWECLRQLCCELMDGKFPLTRLPRETRRWFTGVYSGRHRDIDSFRRSVLQRGGSKAELIGAALKAVSKVALPALKAAGKNVLKEAAHGAVQTGAERLVKKITTKKKKDDGDDELNAQPDSKVDIGSLTVDEILARKW